MKKVYEIARGAISKEVVISELKVLHIGERSIFVRGIDPTWNLESEYTLNLTDKDHLNLVDMFETNQVSAWTDDLDIAEEMKGKIERFILTINNAINN